MILLLPRGALAFARVTGRGGDHPQREKNDHIPRKPDPCSRVRRPAGRAGAEVALAFPDAKRQELALKGKSARVLAYWIPP